MSTITLRDLRIGEIPHVVGTISSIDSLIDFAASQNDICDIVEVRLDEISKESNWLAPCKAIESLGMPVILTIRLQSEGGKWTSPDESRISLFEEALNGLSAVDVEFKSPLMPQVSKLAKSLQKIVVISFHDFEKTPSLDDLKKIASKAASYGSIVKISTMVNSNEDVATLQRLLEFDLEVPLCVIGMGSLATKTRVAFPSLGSCLTYGYLDIPSAPGQLPARTLVEQLRSLLPAYNQQFIIRKQILEYV